MAKEKREERWYMVITQCDCPEKWTAPRSIPLDADHFCYRGLQTLPTSSLCLPWYAFAGVWSASLSLHGVLPGIPGSVRAICEDSLWSRLVKLLNTCLRDLLVWMLHSPLAASTSSGSLTVWLCKCFRCSCHQKLGPLFSAALEMGQAC